MKFGSKTLITITTGLVLCAGLGVVACSSDKKDSKGSSPSSSSSNASSSSSYGGSATTAPAATATRPAAPAAAAPTTAPAAPAAAAPTTAPAAAAPAAAAAAPAVSIIDFAFQPTALTGKAGTALNLNVSNKGNAPHTFTIQGVTDSGTITAGNSKAVTFTPTAAGTLTYFCMIHGQATMSGTLTVAP